MHPRMVKMLNMAKLYIPKPKIKLKFEKIAVKTRIFFFEKHLFATNVVSSGILMALGDITQQQIEYYSGLRNEKVDYPRLGRMTTVGFIEGPLHHFYYGYLDRFLPGMDGKTVFLKIILDQILASPLFISTFFYGMGLLEGKSLRECTKEVKRDIVTVYTADCCVWPPAQFFNFFFLPVEYRVLYINTVTMCYNVFLSYMKHREPPEDSKPTPTDYFSELSAFIVSLFQSKEEPSKKRTNIKWWSW